MEILIIWIGTVIASFGMEISNELRMFKDAADNGYKIDIKAISELAKKINPNASKASITALFIPIFNIMGVFQRTMIYNNARSTILDQLNVINSLTKMTKEEEEEYKKNPSKFNALLITFRPQLESEQRTISYFEGNEKNTISYKMENERFVIIKIEGPISKLSIFEQRAKVIEKLEAVHKNTNSVSLSDEGKSNEDDLSRQEKIEQLEQLKSSVLSEKQEETNPQQLNSSQKILKK